ncbi:hypothetical protein N0V93_001835 [Gnomoniopsis smithogilvyi]|uniref:BTB domain-containing protein n=1 Tax=Gnomoniopsis smithogilvyi TaxID=1191159 RepID=A0A9W8Z6N9_9PEZI|nr:hypothetical protein N0V93_001835 [Gnomoniopsis smithogilvyi]
MGDAGLSGDTSEHGDAGIQVANLYYMVRSFDDDGDLKLEVGQRASKQTFVVCSKALSRASKPFKTMLYGPYAESKPVSQTTSPEWTVALPDDNPDALAVLLNIVHGIFDKVPATLDRGQLFRICVLTDKYDMTHILRPWARQWMEPFLQRSIGKKGDEYLLWIAYVLGEQDLFLKVQKYIYNGFTLDKHGNMLCPFGRRLDDSVYVVKVADLDALARLRAKKIDQLLGCVHTMLSRLAAAEDSDYKCKSRKEADETQEPLQSQECRAFYLGSLIRSLNSAGYFPLPSSATLGCSINQLRDHLDSVCDSMQKMKSLSGPDTKHGNCAPGGELRKSIDSIATGLVLAEARKKQLAQQAKKSGLG